MPRILSGVQPTGNTHIGNYVGARRSDRKGLGPCGRATLLKLMFDHEDSGP